MSEHIEQFKKLAELVKTQLNLEYDQKSVEYLEGFIERQRERWSKDGKKEGLINSLGSFLGECMIKNYGGGWEEDKELGWCIKFNGGEKAFPFNKVKKQFDNDIGDSIFSFYRIIPDLLKKKT